MRTLLIMVMIALSMSCTKDRPAPGPLEFDASVLPQRWELYGMTGSFSGTLVEGEDMLWQEAYSLRRDRSFTKTRITSDATLTGTGRFEFIVENDEVGVLLTFDRDSEIIGNCTGDLVEYLYINADERTLLGSWWACDGPGLFYKRVK